VLPAAPVPTLPAAPVPLPAVPVPAPPAPGPVPALPVPAPPAPVAPALPVADVPPFPFGLPTGPGAAQPAIKMEPETMKSEVRRARMRSSKLGRMVFRDAAEPPSQAAERFALGLDAEHARVALLHDHAALGDRAYDRRQQPVLLGEHAQAQRFLVVVVEHGHRRLRDHDPAHHARGDELHGAARDLQAIAQDFALALQEGIYKKAGLDVTIIKGQGSGVTAQLVATGKADIAYADALAVMQLIAKGAPMKVVSTIYQSNPNAVTMLTASGIKSIAELKGKSVAVPTGQSQTAMVPILFKANGLSESDVNLVNMPGNAMIASLLQKQVDAMLASPAIAAGGRQDSRAGPHPVVTLLREVERRESVQHLRVQAGDDVVEWRRAT